MAVLSGSFIPAPPPAGDGAAITLTRGIYITGNGGVGGIQANGGTVSNVGFYVADTEERKIEPITHTS